jgi:hypothetical protein
MRKFLRVFTPVAAAAALALAVVTPAEAAPGDTSVTFNIGAGALTITVPASANLGTYPAGLTTLAATGQLGDVTVTDNRGIALLNGWAVTASSTDFVSTDYTVPKAQVVYASGSVTTTPAGLSLTLPGASALGLPLPVVTKIGVLGLGSSTATWDPTLTVTFPLNAVVGTYNGTITHSVA